MASACSISGFTVLAEGHASDEDIHSAQVADIAEYIAEEVRACTPFPARASSCTLPGSML